MSLPRIKICGLTQREDAELAARLGAWALGFVFYDKSPRAAEPRSVREIVESLPAPAPLIVGVFVDEEPWRIAKTVKEARLTAVQLHGVEAPSDCAALRAMLPGTQLIKALRPRADESFDVAVFSGVCDAVLIDAYSPTLAGGTGALADWRVAKQLASSGTPLILAGGLEASNVVAALKEVNPFALDASSRLELAPGKKNPDAVRAFFAAASGD